MSQRLLLDSRRPSWEPRTHCISASTKLFAKVTRLEPIENKQCHRLAIRGPLCGSTVRASFDWQHARTLRPSPASSKYTLWLSSIIMNSEVRWMFSSGRRCSQGPPLISDALLLPTLSGMQRKNTVQADSSVDELSECLRRGTCLQKHVHAELMLSLRSVRTRSRLKWARGVNFTTAPRPSRSKSTAPQCLRTRC